MNKSDTKDHKFFKQIPELNKIPEAERRIVFKQTFKDNGYRFFLALISIFFILVFYFNLDNILEYKRLERGGMISRNIHFLKELGLSFFLPLMTVFLILVLGRNYFVGQQVKKFLKNKN